MKRETYGAKSEHKSVAEFDSAILALAKMARFNSPRQRRGSLKEDDLVKILVVDDEKEICDTLQSFLKKRAYDVSVAYNGQEAIEKVKLERPHIVLLDIVMPDISGIEALKKIKAFDKEVGVIMVTAVDDTETARICLKLGAYDYITKPFDPDYLEKSLLVKIVNMLG